MVSTAAAGGTAATGGNSVGTSSAIASTAGSKSSSSSSSTRRQTVRVAIRVRPCQDGQQEAEWSVAVSDKGNQEVRLASVVSGRKKEKKYEGFGVVLHPESDNQRVFADTVKPMLEGVFEGKSVMAFAFGHTGSGKTHTIFGYGEERGVFDQAAEVLCARAEETRGKGPGEELLVELRFSEVLNGKVKDLIGGVECAVREDSDGKVHIRGPTIVEEGTRNVRVCPPARVHATSAQQVREAVVLALSQRRTGNSNVHDQSSRSHALLEMEMITRDLADARDALVTAESELVPVGKRHDDRVGEYWTAGCNEFTEREGAKIAAGMGLEESDPLVKAEIQKQFYAVYQQHPDPEMPKLRAAKQACEAKIAACQERCDACKAAGGPSVGGTLVLVDLAGSEYAMDDASAGAVKRSKAAVAEAKEINKSLLTLKECFRALHSSKANSLNKEEESTLTPTLHPAFIQPLSQPSMRPFTQPSIKHRHVNFRGSKLTMLLRGHLTSQGASACMIANISPGEADARKSGNTLSYSQLVAQAAL